MVFCLGFHRIIQRVGNKGSFIRVSTVSLRESGIKGLLLGFPLYHSESRE